MENKVIDVAIIGGGASGTLASIAIKKKYPTFHIVIFENNKKINKKLYATGNGKFNFSNTFDHFCDAYRRAGIVNNVLKEVSLSNMLDFLKEEIGIIPLNKNGYLYPMNESSETSAFLFNTALLMNKVDIINDKIIKYKKNNRGFTLFSEKNSYECKKLIFATGGRSSSQFGSDGSLFNELIKHGYKIETLRPGLVPIRVKENISLLDGVRRVCAIRLLKNDEPIYSEIGEVQFKKDGLSGIPILNISSLIARNYSSDYKIEINLFPLCDKQEVINDLINGNLKKGLYKYLNAKLSNYMYDLIKDGEIDVKNIFSISLSFIDFYPFENSDVTVGGVSFDNLDSYLMSNIEKDVYFIGEVVDQDGLCGGYNLSWAFLSALLVCKRI